MNKGKLILCHYNRDVVNKKFTDDKEIDLSSGNVKNYSLSTSGGSIKIVQNLISGDDVLYNYARYLIGGVEIYAYAILVGFSGGICEYKLVVDNLTTAYNNNCMDVDAFCEYSGFGNKVLSDNRRMRKEQPTVIKTIRNNSTSEDVLKGSIVMTIIVPKGLIDNINEEARFSDSYNYNQNGSSLSLTTKTYVMNFDTWNYIYNRIMNITTDTGVYEKDVFVFPELYNLNEQGELTARYIPSNILQTIILRSIVNLYWIPFHVDPNTASDYGLKRIPLDNEDSPDPRDRPGLIKFVSFPQDLKEYGDATEKGTYEVTNLYQSYIEGQESEISDVPFLNVDNSGVGHWRYRRHLLGYQDDNTGEFIELHEVSDPYGQITISSKSLSKYLVVGIAPAEAELGATSPAMIWEADSNSSSSLGQNKAVYFDTEIGSGLNTLTVEQTSAAYDSNIYLSFGLWGDFRVKISDFPIVDNISNVEKFGIHTTLDLTGQSYVSVFKYKLRNSSEFVLDYRFVSRGQIGTSFPIMTQESISNWAAMRAYTQSQINSTNAERAVRAVNFIGKFTNAITAPFSMAESSLAPASAALSATTAALDFYAGMVKADSQIEGYQAQLADYGNRELMSYGVTGQTGSSMPLIYNKTILILIFYEYKDDILFNRKYGYIDGSTRNINDVINNAQAEYIKFKAVSLNQNNLPIDIITSAENQLQQGLFKSIIN